MVPEMAPFGVFSCVSLEGLRPAGSDDDQRKKNGMASRAIPYPLFRSFRCVHAPLQVNTFSVVYLFDT